MEHLGICTECNSIFSSEFIGKECPVCKKGVIIPQKEIEEKDDLKFLNAEYSNVRIKEKIGTQAAFFLLGLIIFFGLETFVIWFLLTTFSAGFKKFADDQLITSFGVAFSPILLFLILYKWYSRNPSYPTIIDLKTQNKKLGAIALLSLLTLIGTIFLLVTFGILINFDNYYELEFLPGRWPYIVLLWSIVGLVLYFKVFRFNALSYLEKMGATSLNEELYLTNKVKTLALGIGISDIYVYTFPEDMPNAFAMDDGTHKIVGLSSGLIRWWNLSNAKKIKREDRITSPEIEGIIGHELGHIKNHDARITSYISALLSITGIVISILVILIVIALIFGDKKNRDSGREIDAVIRGGIGLYIAALVFSMTFFRQREYLADLTGAQIISNPSALSDALSKLRNYKPKTIKSVITRAMYQADPEGFDRKNKPSFGEQLFATHPPLEERIKRLKAASHEGKL